MKIKHANNNIGEWLCVTSRYIDNDWPSRVQSVDRRFLLPHYSMTTLYTYFLPAVTNSTIDNARFTRIPCEPTGRLAIIIIVRLFHAKRPSVYSTAQYDIKWKLVCAWKRSHNNTLVPNSADQRVRNFCLAVYLLDLSSSVTLCDTGPGPCPRNLGGLKSVPLNFLSNPLWTYSCKSISIPIKLKHAYVTQIMII